MEVAVEIVIKSDEEVVVRIVIEGGKEVVVKIVSESDGEVAVEIVSKIASNSVSSRLTHVVIKILEDS